MSNLKKISTLLYIGCIFYFSYYSNQQSFSSWYSAGLSDYDKTENSSIAINSGNICNPMFQGAGLSREITAKETLPLKAKINKLPVCFNARKELFYWRFTQYSYFFLNLPVRFQNTLIIFPFHYFW